MNQYHLREMFIEGMPGLHLHLYQFERLLEDTEPALYCHLHRRGVHPQLYATQWFLTLFAYRFPLQLVLRVHDLVLSEGLEGAILKFGILLMQKNARALLGMNDMTSLTTFLKEKLFDIYIDQAPTANSILESGFFGSSGGIDKEIYRADILVQDACAVKITPETLATYTAEWELKVKIEKEREAEIENIRSANASLALKVRSLEERTEKSDAEHVQMASELVHTKVKNEELLDKNDSLEGQIGELRNVVERQPEEVEQRLKAEMDRIMTRNLEVQNENRALEEQMADMEKALVETKMNFAEVCQGSSQSTTHTCTNPIKDTSRARNIEAEMERTTKSDRTMTLHSQRLTIFERLPGLILHFTDGISMAFRSTRKHGGLVFSSAASNIPQVCMTVGRMYTSICAIMASSSCCTNSRVVGEDA